MKNIMNINFKKAGFFLFSILLVFLPSVVFAAGMQIQSFSIPPGDLSVAFLARIFGTVGGGLIGVGPTIFGQIFYVFNWGILMISSIFLTYTTGRSIVEIANADAGQMARKFSWWVPARVVLGVGLLVPQPTGYSTLNTMVMWVTLQGVGLADAVWSQAIDFLQKGGALYTPIHPATASGGTVDQIDKKLVDSDDDVSGVGKKVGVASLLRSEICMKTLYNHLDNKRLSYVDSHRYKLNGVNSNSAIEKKLLENDSTLIPAFSEVCSDSECIFDQSGQAHGDGCVIKFPCNADSYADDLASNLKRHKIDATGTFAAELGHMKGKRGSINGICGEYKWSPVKSGSGTQDYGDAKKTGLQQVILGLNQFADDAVNKYGDDAFTAFIKADAAQGGDPYIFPYSPTDFSSFRGFSQQVYQALVTEAGAYQATIYQIRLFAANNYQTHDINQTYVCEKDKNTGIETCSWKLPSGTNSITQKMLDQGWIVAGSYYFSIMSVKTANASNGENEYYRIYATTPPPSCTTSGDSNCNITGDLSAALSGGVHDDLESLKLRLQWVGYKDSFGISSKAYALAKDLNEAAANVAETVNLPQELKDFVGKRQVKIATGAYVLTDMVLNPLNDRLRNVFCKWGLNLGLNENDLNKCGDGYGKDDVAVAANMSPIERLQTLGQSMIDECVSIWTNIFASMTAIVTSFYVAELAVFAGQIALAVGSFMGITTGGVIAFQTGLTVIQDTLKFFFEIPFYAALPIVSAVSLLMLTTGVTLAYYIPLLPFMLFIFGAIGWLAFVIEAMVAAPLVALGITHPEGHDLMGKSEQGIMMLLSVFVRPSAMLIGLIAGMVVSYVALDVLNAGFGTIIGSLYYGGIGNANVAQLTTGSLVSSTVNSTAVAQIRNSAMILVYVMIAMAIVQQCFSLIHIIPTKIMHWIGVGAEAGMEGQLAEGVKGGVTGAAEKVGGAIGQTSIRGTPSLPATLREGKKDEPDSSGPKVESADANAGRGTTTP